MKPNAGKKTLGAVREKMNELLTDESRRHTIQYFAVYFMLSFVAAFMTVLNAFTRKGPLTIATLVFALLCLANAALLYWLPKHGLRLSSILFAAELMLLFLFFIISGSPDGFSVIWISLLPAAGMLLFGLRRGTVYSLAMFLVLVFFFWTPLGRGLLQYQYNETFLARFPILYIAFFLVAGLLEYIRYVTQQELDRLRERYRFYSSHDYLTRLLNRHGLQDLRARTTVKGPQSAMMLDIDYFKKVNDTYGHDVGDLVLQEVAQTIEKHTDQVLCRWGGEEFVVWFNGSGDPLEVAEQIRRSLEDTVIPIPNSSKTVRVTISIGVAQGKEGDKLEELITLADERLYAAKHSGRNRVVCE